MKWFVSLLSCLILFSSCRKDGFNITESGLKYHIYEEKKGKKPVPGDVLVLHLTYKNQDDSLLYDSKILGDSFMLELTKPSFHGGIEEGLMLMGEGDSAAFLLNADSVYDKLFKLERPLYIDKGEILRFDVRLKRVLKNSEEGLSEDEIMLRYFARNNISVNPDIPGVFFFIFKEGGNKHPVKGDSVEIRYTAHTTSGAVFIPAGRKPGNIQYRIGNGLHVPAFDNAVMSIGEGGLARLALASSFFINRPEFSKADRGKPLIFDIELIKIY